MPRSIGLLEKVAFYSPPRVDRNLSCATSAHNTFTQNFLAPLAPPTGRPPDSQSSQGVGRTGSTKKAIGHMFSIHRIRGGQLARRAKGRQNWLAKEAQPHPNLYAKHGPGGMEVVYKSNVSQWVFFGVRCVGAGGWVRKENLHRRHISTKFSCHALNRTACAK